MKDVTNELRGIIKIKKDIPERIKSKIEEELRIFKLENIKDIRENYDTISRSVELYDVEPERRLACFLENSGLHVSFKIRPNICFVDNVFLRNVSIGTFPLKKYGIYIRSVSELEEQAKTCKFDIFDIHNESIKGIVTYENREGKGEVAKILRASPSTPFDIIFCASENYLLYVKKVQKSDYGEREKISIPSNGSKVPVLQPA